MRKIELLFHIFIMLNKDKITNEFTFITETFTRFDR
jgi:hypothetical protein